MTDYFALLGEARRAWLDPEELKEKYFALVRERPAEAELNEAFRVLSNPKLRLHHLLVLEGADLSAGRPVPPGVAELFWNTGTLLREIDSWLLKNANSGSALSRALLGGERVKLARSLETQAAKLDTSYANALERLRARNDHPNEPAPLIELHDSLAYLTRLREQTKEKRLQLELALSG